MCARDGHRRRATRVAQRADDGDVRLLERLTPVVIADVELAADGVEGTHHKLPRIDPRAAVICTERWIKPEEPVHKGLATRLGATISWPAKCGRDAITRTVDGVTMIEVLGRHVYDIGCCAIVHRKERSAARFVGCRWRHADRSARE